MNVFENVGGFLENEEFQELASSEYVKIERIVSTGHRSAENHWYDQPENEWVLVLSGRGVIEYEDGRVIGAPEGTAFDLTGTAATVEGLTLDSPLTLAFKVSAPPGVPVTFDLRIDDRPATASTYIGDALRQPSSMPRPEVLSVVTRMVRASAGKLVWVRSNPRRVMPQKKPSSTPK